ncbi:MAG: hypothetical protein EAZ98_09270 [Oscillatoriales cyanobacterium]|nr:MAG: hypothetical protein EAZ98_09270 [Oscillatoriales cyanobacterium]
MYNKTFLRNLSIAGLTLSGAIALSGKPASAAPTTFQCITSGSGYATIAVAGGKKTNPLITYNNPVFSGSGFTPQKRCQEISGRLETAVANNGGKLSGLLLTVGEVNGYDVICYVNNNQSGCDSGNLLMTLPPRTNPGQTLATFLNVSAQPFTSPNPVRMSRPRTYIPFGDAVEQELNSAGGDLDNSTPRDNGGGSVNPNPSDNGGGSNKEDI